MRRSDFSYPLPAELIAQRPLPSRSGSRLLVLEGETGAVRDGLFVALPELLKPGDLMVFNDTRVIRARLFGRKESGGAVEFLLERVTDENRALGQARSSKPLRPGVLVTLEDGTTVKVEPGQDGLYHLDFGDRRVTDVLESAGHVPLPPYVKRPDDAGDERRYQTVYARVPGAVAAPTAGLHFDLPLLEKLSRKGVKQCFVTLHVGAGTFQPLRVENIREHRMHSEYAEVNRQVCEAVEQTRRDGGRVIAVGTTAVRSLESAAAGGNLQPFTGDTSLFIYPGYRFKVVDALLTNFHLPESTLLMLVAAFAGREQVLAAYTHAVAERYRFFSYGDAMFVTPRMEARR